MTWAQVAATLLVAAVARAEVRLEARLTPLPGGPPEARGLAVLTLRDDGTVRWELRVADLGGFATVTELRVGAAGPGVVALTNPPASGTHIGRFGPLAAEAQAALVDARWWLHVATASAPDGALHGLILPAAIDGRTCGCAGAASGAAFRACVRTAVRRLPRAQRRTPGVRALKRAAQAASCGPPTRRARTRPGCCLPRTPAGNVVVERLCVPRAAGPCTRLGGMRASGACSASPPACSREAP
ncbi:MAG: CHRD domain-containing protein [bacterium]|nr:CHRD domain-containing protein [bacterium]